MKGRKCIHLQPIDPYRLNSLLQFGELHIWWVLYLLMNCWKVLLNPDQNGQHVLQLRWLIVLDDLLAIPLQMWTRHKNASRYWSLTSFAISSNAPKTWTHRASKTAWRTRSSRRCGDRAPVINERLRTRRLN